MTIGDWNKKFGWIWLLIGPLMGLYMTGQFRVDPAYTALREQVMIAGQNLTLYMGEGTLRASNRLLHAHSALLALLNIVYGMSIDNVPLLDKTKKLGSILAIAGAILVTLASFVSQVALLSDLGFPFRVLGGTSVVVAIIMLAVGELKK